MQVKKQQLEPDVDWSEIAKGVCQGCILSPGLFSLYAEHIMRNAGLDDLQAGIKTARRNIDNLRYADNTTLMAESEEELKSLLMKVKKESEKADLKLNIQKTNTKKKKNKDHGIRSHNFMVKRRRKRGNSDRFY